MKKIQLFLIAAIAILGWLPLTAQEHNHAEQAKTETSHVTKAGPNGGKIFRSTQPPFELYLQDDRKIRITFLGEDDQPIDAANQRISAVGGSRSNPTRMIFAADGDGLISNIPLPDGNNVPLILNIKPTPESKTVIERININIAQCSSCSYLEYACICGH